MWVGEMKSSGDENYTKWKGRIQSFTYLFEQDLNLLTDNCHLFEAIISKSGHPKSIKSYLAGKISLETLVVLDDLTSFTSKLSDSYDPVLNLIKTKIHKYRQFLTIIRILLSKNLDKNVIVYGLVNPSKKFPV